MIEHDKQPIAAPARPADSVDAPLIDRAGWARILPFATYILFIVAADLLDRVGFTRAELLWLYPVQIGAVALLLALFWRQYTELKGISISPTTALAAVAAGVLVLVLWINLNADWMVFGSSAGYDPRANGELDWTLTVIRILGAALVVPVMEELFWRSFLMRWVASSDFLRVDPARVGLKAFVITVVLFGFEHNLWLAGIVAGAVYSLLYMRTRSLWPAILAHAVTNGLLGIWVVATGSWSYW